MFVVKVIGDGDLMFLVPFVIEGQMIIIGFSVCMGCGNISSLLVPKVIRHG